MLYDWKTEKNTDPVVQSPWNPSYVGDAGRIRPGSVTIPGKLQYVAYQYYGTSPYWDFDHGNYSDFVIEQGNKIPPTENETDMILIAETYTSSNLITRGQGNQKLDVQDLNRFQNVRFSKVKSLRERGYIVWTNSGTKITGTVVPPKDHMGNAVDIKECYSEASYRIFPNCPENWYNGNYVPQEDGLYFYYQVFGHTSDIEFPENSDQSADIEAVNGGGALLGRVAGDDGNIPNGKNTVGIRKAWTDHGGFEGQPGFSSWLLSGTTKIEIYVSHYSYTTGTDDLFHFKDFFTGERPLFLMEGETDAVPKDTIGILPTGKVYCSEYGAELPD